jgi:hypothetical protein
MDGRIEIDIYVDIKRQIERGERERREVEQKNKQKPKKPKNQNPPKKNSQVSHGCSESHGKDCAKTDAISHREKKTVESKRVASHIHLLAHSMRDTRVFKTV